MGATSTPHAAVRALRGALDVIVDLSGLLVMVWLIPFAILAISGPIVLILRAILALVHRL